MDIKIYKNLLWELLDQGSQLFILSLLMEQGFEGECKLESFVDGEVALIKVTDTHDRYIELPINILDILND